MSPTRRPTVERNPFTLLVKADRRMPDVRRRLARLSKPELIEQLLELQDAYAVVLQVSAGKLTKKLRRK